MSEIHQSTEVPKLVLHNSVNVPVELLEGKSVEKEYYTELYKQLTKYKTEGLVYTEAVISPDGEDMKTYRDASVGTFLALKEAFLKLSVDYGYWMLVPNIGMLDSVIDLAKEFNSDPVKGKRFCGIALYAMGEVIPEDKIGILNELPFGVDWIIDEPVAHSHRNEITDKIFSLKSNEDAMWRISFINGANTMSDLMSMDAKSAYLQFIKSIDFMFAEDRMKQSMSNIVEITLNTKYPSLRDKIKPKVYVEKRIKYC